MVTKITPPYYAADSQGPLEFTLEGVNFNLIPNDAVGVLADHNNNPLEYKDTTFEAYKMGVEHTEDGKIVVTNGYSSIYTTAKFLGAILSADRQTVYWVNETNPLP